MARKKTAPEKQLTRKQISRREREERLRRRLIAGTSAVLGLVILLIGWGVVNEYVLRPRQPVATVAGTPIPLRDYQFLLRYRRWEYRNYLAQLEEQRRQMAAADDEGVEVMLSYLDQQIDQAYDGLQNLPITALDEMIEAELMRQELTERGLAVSEEEIERAFELRFGYDRDPAAAHNAAEPAVEIAPVEPDDEQEPALPTPAPMTESEFLDRSAGWLEVMGEATGLDRDDYLRLVVRPTVYSERLAEALEAELPTGVEQVRARHILVASEEDAREALERIGAGEPFEEVAAEVSQDAGTRDMGGDLGWFPRGHMVDEFDEAAFALAPGVLSEPVNTVYGWHIIRVEERDAARPLEPEIRDYQRREALYTWLTERRTAPDIERHWDATMVPAE